MPASLVSSVPTKELQTQLIGQIARAATIYHVDEIIVYEDTALPSKCLENEKSQARSASTSFIARILQYCECPEYLRKHFFPLHPSRLITSCWDLAFNRGAS